MLPENPRLVPSKRGKPPSTAHRTTTPMALPSSLREIQGTGRDTSDGDIVQLYESAPRVALNMQEA